MGNYKFSAELYKNYKEPLWMLNNSWIDKIVERHDGIDEFNLTIPQYVYTDNGREKNKAYDLIKSKQQVVITKIDGTQDRYIVSDRKGLKTKITGQKQFTCYQFQKSLEKIRFKIDAGNYYFVKQPTLSNLDGIMDKWCTQSGGWSLGTIDSALYYNDEMVEEKAVVNYNLSTVTNVQYEDKILDLNVNLSASINTYGQNPLYINIEYENVHTSEANYNTVYNDFDVPFYTGITNIKAYYYSEAGNRYGIKYVFTLSDNQTETIIKTFENVTGKDLLWDLIKITYSTGNYVKQNTLKYPYFDEVDDNAYKFLQDIEDVFDCIFTFDTINKKINAYPRATYGTEQGLELSLESNCLDVSDTEGEEIPTGLRVIGKTVDNTQVSIVSQNPFGGDVIYNYDYYINEGLLSDECVTAWRKYVARLEIRQDEWDELQTKSLDISNALISVESLITSLNLKITYTNDRLSACVSGKDTINQATISAELTDYQNQLSQTLSKKSSLETQYDENENVIQNFAIGNLRENCVDVNGNKIFTQEDLTILSEVDEIITVNDDYYTTSFSLYKKYKSYLEDKIIPSKDFVINSTNMDKYLAKNNSIISVGSVYLLDDELNGFIGTDKVRLSEMEYKPYEDGSIKLTKLSYTTKYKKTDVLNKSSNINRRVSKATTKLDSWSNIINNANISNNYVSELRKGILNLANTRGNGNGSSNLIDISQAGIFVTETENKDNRIYIGSSVICITDDGFKTSKTAITSKAIVADLLAGIILLGNRLKIEGDSGSFYIGDEQTETSKKAFGLYVYDKDSGGNLTTQRLFLGTELDIVTGIRHAKIQLTDKTGNNVVLSDEGILQCISDSGFRDLDASNPAYFYVWVDSGVNRIDTATLRLRLERMVSTVTTTSFSGSTITTASGGGSTSSSNGYISSTTSTISGHVHKVFNALHSSAQTGDITKCGKYSDLNGVVLYIPIDSSDTTPDNLTAPIYTAQANDSHNHSFSIDSHSHWCPDHQHNLDYSHQHNITHAVYLSDMASNVSIAVNGNVIATGINGVDNEFEIKSFLNKNQWNEIKFSSQTNGRVSWNYFMKSFNMF